MGFGGVNLQTILRALMVAGNFESQRVVRSIIRATAKADSLRGMTNKEQATASVVPG
jgi:hypothetical protein